MGSVLYTSNDDVSLENNSVCLLNSLHADLRNVVAYYSRSDSIHALCEIGWFEQGMYDVCCYLSTRHSIQRLTFVEDVDYEFCCDVIQFLSSESGVIEYVQQIAARFLQRNPGVMLSPNNSSISMLRLLLNVTDSDRRRKHVFVVANLLTVLFSKLLGKVRYAIRMEIRHILEVHGAFLTPGAHLEKTLQQCLRKTHRHGAR